MTSNLDTLCVMICSKDGLPCQPNIDILFHKSAHTDLHGTEIYLNVNHNVL